MKICPTCGTRLPDPRRPKRICSSCGKPIGSHHKWEFSDDGRPVHRSCDDPESYPQTNQSGSVRQKTLLEETQ